MPGPIETEYVERGKGFSALKRAINHARELGTRLTIAKVGKLVYSVEFLQLLEGVEFVCLDQPLNHRTLPAYLERAKHFSRLVSEKTKEGLVGKTMGYARPGAVRPNSQPKAIKAASKARTKRAQMLYEKMPLRELRDKGLTYDQIAAELNEAGHRTTLGTPFNGPTVCRILQRET